MASIGSPSWKVSATFVLQILSPALVLACYILTSLIVLFKSGEPSSSQDKPSRFPKRLAIALNVGIILLFVGESILLAYEDPLWALFPNASLACTLFSNLIWVIMLVGLIDTEPGGTAVRFCGPWAVSLVLQTALFVINMADPNLLRGAHMARSVLQIVRLALTGGLLCLVAGSKVLNKVEKADDEEVAPLLIASVHDHETPGAANGKCYGTAAQNGHVDASTKKSSDKQDDSKGAESKDGSSAEDDDEDDSRHVLKMTKNWWVYVKAFRILLPYLWPKTLRLQLHFPALAITVLADRVLNVAVPIILGKLINSLSDARDKPSVPWTMITLYVLFRLLGSQAGISLVRNLLWQPVEKNAHIQLSVAGYNHVMNMSCDFHDSKASARLWQTLQRGLSITQLFEVLSFELLPMAADLVLAISVFWWLFDSYMAFIVASVVLLFLWSTKKGIGLKTAKRRIFINAWEDEYRQLTESSQNWTTVSYFNRVKYEIGRHTALVTNCQATTIAYQLIGYYIGAMRSLTLLSGLFAGSCLALYQIIYGHRRVGDFVVLLTYWQQLTGPLNFFAYGFSMVAENLVNSEKFLVLMQKTPTVRDRETASQLVVTKGEVDFKNVTFSYDGKRQVTNDVTLHVKSGDTIALVGETGGGKSTILKLLFRFYDVTGGQILIDGQDVRDITLESLRENVGVVPQDPSLFNQTILENLRYAKLDATVDEIQSACKAVALHDKIVSFTKGYESKVGERGVKLSGGELQRMAIARAMLKDPKILLLDEATSSVDSETESRIQASLKSLCAGRTTFVIAHRLSTIVDADVVVVINDGQIVEQGSHTDLLKNKGHYHKLWTRQLKEQKIEDRPRSRSRSPAKSEGLVLVNGGNPEDDDVVLLDQAVGDANDSQDNSDVHIPGNEESHGSDQGLEEAPSEPAPAVPMKSALRRLNVEAPEFVPTTLKANNTSAASNGVHQDSQTSNPLSTLSLSAISGEKSNGGPRRNVNPPSHKREAQDVVTEMINGTTIPADRVPPRRMGAYALGRKATQSEPSAESGFGAVDGAKEESEVFSEESSTGKEEVAGKRAVSAPLATKGGAEGVPRNGFQNHTRMTSTETNVETDEEPASPQIKAPANTPARDISEDALDSHSD